MKNIKPGDTPFNTSNAILAYSLHLAGVPWHNDRYPCKVFYSKPILDKFMNGSGSPYYKGWELEEAVKHAHKTGRRGHVEFILERVPRLSKLLKAYRDQVAELESRDGFLHELVSELAAKVNGPDPDIAKVRLYCVILQKRMDFMELWTHQVPRYIIPNPGRVTRSREVIQTKDGPREAIAITSPGMKIISVNASEETRKALGV
jgi:hypothetical protein